MEGSAAVGGDHILDILALDADELNVLASVDTAGKAAQDAGEVEQAASPGDGHTPHFTSGDVRSVSAAELARSAVVVIVIVDHDDGGLLLAPVHGLLHAVARLLTVHGLPVCGRWLSISRRGLSVSRLSVHLIR